MKQVSKDKDNNRVAIIDIGSNTFHLIIVDLSSEAEKFELIYRERIFVYLAKEGIEFLSQETIERGIVNLSELLEKCNFYNVAVVKAIGTAALRSAENADVFINKVKSQLDLDIEIISGKREAEFIYKGITFSGVKMDRPSLIVDIGGGSVEFIIVNNDNIIFYDSYDIGISQLRHQFKNNDPITDDDIRLIYNYLDIKLVSFLSQAIQSKVEIIIGASGPFEIIESMCEVDVEKQLETSKHIVLDMINGVIQLPLKARSKLPLMPVDRADLSVESLLLIRYLFIRLQSLKAVIISPYALKEGLISELI